VIDFHVVDRFKFPDPKPRGKLMTFDREVLHARAVLNGFEIQYKGNNDQSVLKLKIDLATYRVGDPDIPDEFRNITPNQVVVVARPVLRDDDDFDGNTGWVDAVVLVKLK
jgi:hypothetical protein